MKKFALKIVLMLVVVVGLSNYGLYLMTGQSPFSHFKLPDFSVPDLSAANPLNNQPEKAWKWVDENGVTHYSTEAPPQNQLAEELEVDPNTNVIQSVEIPKKQEPEDTTITPVEGPIYDPATINKLMEDAKNVEKVLQERHEKQEEIINSL